MSRYVAKSPQSSLWGVDLLSPRMAGTPRCASWNWFAIQAVPVGSDLLSKLCQLSLICYPGILSTLLQPAEDCVGLLWCYHLTEIVFNSYAKYQLSFWYMAQRFWKEVPLNKVHDVICPVSDKNLTYKRFHSGPVFGCFIDTIASTSTTPHLL